MGFSRQGYWSGFPCPPPGHLPNPGIKPPSLTSPALVGRFFSTSTTWEVSDRPQTSTSGSSSKAHTLQFCSWNLMRDESFSQQHWGERVAPSITELLGICNDARHESSGPASLFTEQQPPIYSTQDWPLPPGTLSALGWHSFNCWQKVMAQMQTLLSADPLNPGGQRLGGTRRGYYWIWKQMLCPFQLLHRQASYNV